MSLMSRISPPNGLVLVLDPASGVLPESLGTRSIAASPSALVVGTLAEFDGQTEIHLADATAVPGDEPQIGIRRCWRIAR